MRTIEEVIAELRKDIHSDVYLGKKTINTYLDEILEIHKAERPYGKWIPVSERRFPDDETEVLIQYGESMMVGYHIFDRTIYPFGYEDENETGWYDSKDNFICGSDEVIAWMPKPEPYKETENEDCN